MKKVPHCYYVLILCPNAMLPNGMSLPGQYSREDTFHALLMFILLKGSEWFDVLEMH